ncbi:hypothetical protein [Streptomyces zingiberis]|uniref:Membrane transport protein MMPL domain-containing protein n=1 Tax=Streptomyces zingiberis TaxID=2053010 RepID=A0ABX1C2F4_9ACTN|nr:hypothetical protein [Streptomyces zingiberis]NJQ01809.1 hypothetical protein [Streptomyces zingiberis]
MPRPTAAQFASGSATVVCTTLLMLVLSETRSVVGIASIALAGLALGLFVAVTVPLSGASRAAAGPSRTTRSSAVPAAALPAQGAAGRAERQRAGAGAHSAHG